MIVEFRENSRHNLFEPLLLSSCMGLLVLILRAELEFPQVMYQGLTIYLLVSIGWKGGQELAKFGSDELWQAIEFMGVGFIIGVAAYLLLRSLPKLRKVDAATVVGYYGADSAGTFATCNGVLERLVVTRAAASKFAAYIPVMLGNMPDEPGYNPRAAAPEPGMTASRKLRDLEHGGVPFVALGIIMPIAFATLGLVIARLSIIITKNHLDLGTSVMSSILCVVASCLAVPAVQGWRSPRPARPCRWPPRPA